MFTLNELIQIRASLLMAQKSAQRLANREGQPTSVAVEYRKAIDDVGTLVRKTDGEIVKLTPRK